MKRILWAIFCIFAATKAAPNAVDDIFAAADMLATATSQLEQVETSRDRVAALTNTIRAIETGMAALRAGQRSAAIQQATIERNLEQQDAQISQLLGTLIFVERSEKPTFLLHPMGPLGTARSAMIAAEVTPALREQAAILNQRLLNVQALRDAQDAAQQVLQRALVDLQTARVQLSQAISDRTDLPRRFTADPIKTAILVASAQTLETFANGLSQISQNEIPVDLPQFADLQGQVPWPALGQITRGFNQADAAGITRPGLIMATQPNALLTAPIDATVRYNGPLLDYGQVIILEPASDTLIILAGLDRIFAKTGEVVIKDTPIGLMGDHSGGGAVPQDRLYIELRHKQKAVDPTRWFIGG